MCWGIEVSHFGMLEKWQPCIMVSQIILSSVQVDGYKVKTVRGPEMNLDGYHTVFQSFRI